MLHETGSSYAEIARECGLDWRTVRQRTVRKYLHADADVAPPRAPSRAGVIYERLVADHGFTGHYQRVKQHLGVVRPLIEDELLAQR